MKQTLSTINSKLNYSKYIIHNDSYKNILQKNEPVNNITRRQYRFFLNQQFWDYLYFAILALYLLYYSSQTIQYPSDWTGINYYCIHTLLIVYVIFKYAFMDKMALKTREGIIILLLLFSFIFSYQNTGYTELFDTALLIIGAKNIQYTDILKTYISVKIPFIALVMIGSQSGIIENLIYNQNGRIREAFGFVYPTDFAAQIFFLIAAWVLIRQTQTSLLELATMILIAIFLKIYCDARCSELSICLIVGIVLFLKYEKSIFKNYNHCFKNIIRSIVQLGCLGAPYGFCMVMIFLCRFYNPDVPFFNAINAILSQRLRLGKKVFNDYNIKLYGQYIPMQGNGGTIQKPADYTFIDCSYISILMRYGLLVFIVVFTLITYMMLKNYQNLLLIGMITLICLHSMIEQHLFEIHYDFILLLPFCRWCTDANPYIFRHWKKE